MKIACVAAPAPTGGAGAASNAYTAGVSAAALVGAGVLMMWIICWIKKIIIFYMIIY